MGRPEGKLVAFTPPRPLGRVMTIEQVGEHLQVSMSTVKRLIDAGQLMRIKIGRTTRVTEAEVNRYIDSLTATAEAEFRRIS